jgi:hypothetical protein
MIWLFWILLCLGPPAILYYKGREPSVFFLISFGLSGGMFLLGWGFMTLTGAVTSMADLTGQLFGFVGIVAAYILAIMATPTEAGGKFLHWERKTETQCPNCAGFISKDDTRCPHCGASVA